jgi:hypothetical protein
VVFELLSTPERLPEWNVSIERACRLIAAEPIGLGSRAICSGRLLGQTVESETEVIGFEPPRFFATRALRGPRVLTRFLVDPQPYGSHLEIELSGEVPGGAVGARLAESFLKKELAVSLERLRRLAEHSAERLT